MTMTDLAERMARVEEAQRGLNTYLPLLLKRFEGIEDRLEADLKTIEQKLEADIKVTRQELRETERKIEADLSGIRTEARNYSRTIIISVLGTGLAIAASIYFT